MVSQQTVTEEFGRARFATSRTAALGDTSSSSTTLRSAFEMERIIVMAIIEMPCEADDRPLATCAWRAWGPRMTRTLRGEIAADPERSAVNEVQSVTKCSGQSPDRCNFVTSCTR